MSATSVPAPLLSPPSLTHRVVYCRGTPSTTHSVSHREYVIDGVQDKGVFSFDLTLPELRNLTARQVWPFR